MLLATKLHIPKRYQAPIPRSHLLQILNSGLQRPLTLVSAPAGFGKTTLIVSWLESLNKRDIAFAWLSLDEADNDLTHFVTYFIEALKGIHPHIGLLLQDLLASHGALKPKQIATYLINDIIATQTDIIIVLDDYHLIHTEAIHQTITFLLQNMPPTMHLVIISRADPPLTLSRLRARGQVTEIRANQLRFTTEDTRAFFRQQTLPLNLTSANLATLQERTEGWIAGLQMVAITMQSYITPNKPTDFTHLITRIDGNHRYIADYLVDEVLSQQTEAVYQFLLQTSILDRLSVSLCDAVTQQNNGQTNLRLLERNNLFIIPLDNQRQWYRYHHLFADLLQKRLRQTYPHQTAVLHQRASQWYEANGMIVEAIKHAQITEDYDRVAYLFNPIVSSLMVSGEFAAVERWLNVIPQTIIYQHPFLALCYGWRHLAHFRFDEIEICLQAAEQNLQTVDPDTKRYFLGAFTALRQAAADSRGDFAQALALGKQALTYLNDNNFIEQALIAINSGNVYSLWYGDTVVARKHLHDAIIFGQATSAQNWPIILSSISHLARLDALEGNFAEARKRIKQTLNTIKADDIALMPPYANLLLIILGQILYEQNDLEAATHHIMQGITNLHTELIYYRMQGHITLAMLSQIQGEPQKAIKYIQEIYRLIIRHNPHNLLYKGYLTATYVRLWLMQNNIESATHWAQSLDPLPISSRPTLWHSYEQMTWARLWLADKQLPRAYECLTNLRPILEANHWTTYLIETLILLALTQQALGQFHKGTATLVEALILAQPSQYIRLFVNEGAAIRPLLHHASHQTTVAAYAQKLLNILALNHATIPILNTPSKDLLSQREQEVLHLAAVGHSNHEIATQLVISPATAKRHMSNIYQKLGVNSRIQAVSRARELGILTM